MAESFRIRNWHTWPELKRIVQKARLGEPIFRSVSTSIRPGTTYLYRTLGITQRSPPIQHRGSNALEVSISWPVELNGQVPLKLVVRGSVVHSVEGVAAIEINQREFRTQASQGSTAVRISTCDHGGMAGHYRHSDTRHQKK